MNLVIETIKERRSIRGFKPQQVSSSDLRTVLDCALSAPSACNKQSWHFTIIQNPELIQSLNDTAKTNLKKSNDPLFRQYGEDDTALLYGAPTLIMVSGDDEDYDAIIDCSAAVENILIAAQSLGLGTLWNGLINFAFQNDDVKEKTAIPAGYTTYFGIAIGYAIDGVELMKKQILTDSVIDYIK